MRKLQRRQPVLERREKRVRRVRGWFLHGGWRCQHAHNVLAVRRGVVVLGVLGIDTVCRGDVLIRGRWRVRKVRVRQQVFETWCNVLHGVRRRQENDRGHIADASRLRRL